MSKRSKSAEAETESTDATEATEQPSAAETAPEASVTSERPNEDQLVAAAKAGKQVQVTLLPPHTRAKIAGLPLGEQPVVVPVSRVLDFGREYVRALAVDERITVTIV